MPPSPLERDRALLASIRGTSIPLRRGNSGKVADDVLAVTRRKLAEECAAVLQKEIARLEALTVASPDVQHAPFAVQRLKEMQAAIRKDVGADAAYQALPAELRKL
jgi:uncharacterized small protein (DUF1192 family)